jgi:recombination protein RecA
MGILVRIPDPEPFEDGRQPAAIPTLPEPRPATRRWGLEAVAGAVAEINANGAAAGLTAARQLLREAQEKGEPVAWIAAGDSFAYAPDLHAGGVDLDALPMIRVPGAVAGARAAEHLLRSGAFGLVVLDLERCSGPRSAGPRITSAAAVRLAALCRRHQAALVVLARKPAGGDPVVPLASLRVESKLRRKAFDRFTCRLQILKDKRQGTGWSHEEICRGPDGLC